MDILTSNAIKIFFPNPSLVQVYFEALANSLDAGASEITLEINLRSFSAPDTLEVTISDNGTGFDEASFERFQHLLSPQDAFHKGLGRLVYLNYFDQVDVKSVWGNQQRSFCFSQTFGGENDLATLETTHDNQTTLAFKGFSRERIKSYDYLKPSALKELIIEQFLPTLHERRNNGQEFTIKIKLTTEESSEQREFISADETITAADLPELELLEINDPSLDAFEGIKMYYQIKEGMGEQTVLTAACIDGRTIPMNLLPANAVPLNHSVVCLFYSKLFEGSADSSRQKLALPDRVSEASILQLLRSKIGGILSERIPAIAEQNQETKRRFEGHFPHLLGYFDDATVGLIDRDDALDLAQRRFFKDQKEVLQCEILDDNTFEKSLELSSRTLTEYILYRDLIIRRMKEMTEENSEADIHNLIVPRYRQFDGEHPAHDAFCNNAWLLDDKFMSFQTILSESKMKEIIEVITLEDDASNDNGRPDIAMVFTGDPEHTEHVDVVIVEIKKKTDSEKENTNAVNQLLDRAQKLVDHCPNIQRVWYYAVLQVDDVLARRLEQLKWAPLYSSDKVFYQDFETKRPDGKMVPTPTFVLSFDAIIGDAQNRNHIFLEILKSGMRALAESPPPSLVTSVSDQATDSTPPA